MDHRIHRNGRKFDKFSREATLSEQDLAPLPECVAIARCGCLRLGNRLRCAHDVLMIGICRPTEAE